MKLITDLWGHQNDGYDLTVKCPGSMLAFQMACGKSLVGVAHIARQEPPLTLIVCPKAVQAGWLKQFNLHTDKVGLMVSQLEGSTAKKALRCERLMQLSKATKRQLVILCNYDTVYRKDMANLLLKNKWDLVIADESHRLKSPGGKTSRFMANLAKRTGKRICMTGTPMPNSMLDVYAQYRFQDVSIFGNSFNRYKNHYAVMGGYLNYEIKGWKNQEEFREKFYSCALMVSNDVLDLPPVRHIERNCDLSANAMRIYKDMRRELVADINSGVVSATNGLVRLLRLAQITNGVVKNELGQEVVVDSSKLELFEELLDEVPIDEPLITFCRFTSDVRRCKEAAVARGRTVGELSGHADDLAKFQDGKVQTLIIQVQSGAEGVELQNCGERPVHFVVYFGIDFSLKNYEQSLARSRRPGRKKVVTAKSDHVTYIHLIANNTVDVKFYATLEKKLRDINSFQFDITDSRKGAIKIEECFNMVIEELETIVKGI
jgi:SNF2 family DNA or RNA helicase